MFHYCQAQVEKTKQQLFIMFTACNESLPLFSLLSELKQRYKITAVPKLVIVKENGDMITDKGRKQIRDRGLACFRSWLDAAEIFQNFKG